MNFYRVLFCLFTAILLSHTTLTRAQNHTAHASSAVVSLPKLRLETAQTLSFKARYFTRRRVEQGMQFGYLADYDIQAAHPNRLRVVDVSSTLKTRTRKLPGGTISILPSTNYVSDGKMQLEWDGIFKNHTQSRAAATLAGLHGELGQPSMIHADLLFTPNALQVFHFRRVGTDTVNGKQVVLYNSGAPNELITSLYLEAHTLLPVRISTGGIETPGHWMEEDRTDYSDWKIDVKLPDGIFGTTPPPGSQDLRDALARKPPTEKPNIEK